MSSAVRGRFGLATRAAGGGMLPLAGLVVLALLPALFLAIHQPFLVSVASRIVIWAIATTSLDLILGFGGMVSFGHAAFVGLGGYTVGVLAAQHHAGTLVFGILPGTERFIAAVPAAVLVAMVGALVIGALSLRTGGVQFIMITLAFGQMVYFLFVSLRAYGGEDGLNMANRDTLFGMGLGNDTVFYYLCLALLVAFLALCRRVVGSRFGMVLQGIRENERRMVALGYTTYGYKLVAFVIAGAGAGLAGALLANLDRFVSPDMLHWTRSGDLLIMAVIGGIGTLYGATLGAAVVIGLETALSPFTDHWMIVLGPILILIAEFVDRGMAGALVRRG
jgi:branched-chain amino acid transport system permease protein